MSGEAQSCGVRVILVGRTGLDQSLRASPEVELLRVRTTLEAIGELAQPLDAESPDGAIVVVGDEGARPSAAECAEFAAAARQVESRVVIVGMAVGGGEGAFDGVVAGAADVLALAGRASGNEASDNGARLNGSKMNGSHAEPAPSGVETLISSILRRGETDATGRDSTSETLSPIVSEQVGTGAVIENDVPMVEAVLRGHDVLEAGLAVLRGRLRRQNVVFVSRQEAAKAAMGAADGAPVAWGEAVFGWIAAPGVSAEVLSGHATWLAGWLRLRDQQAELRNAAFKDPLTGAWNRRYFDRFLSSAIEQCRESRRTMTLMVFDIDDFKKYNDKYGHAAGDEILAETVRLMSSVVRPTDRVCRIGGDEFGVIFFEPEGPREQNSRHPDSVCKIAERFQQQIGRHKFPKLGSEAPGSLTISGGLATFPWDGGTPEQLMCRADERSMESKKSGKNALTLGPRAIRRGE